MENRAGFDVSIKEQHERRGLLWTSHLFASSTSAHQVQRLLARRARASGHGLVSVLVLLDPSAAVDHVIKGSAPDWFRRTDDVSSPHNRSVTEFHKVLDLARSSLLCPDVNVEHLLTAVLMTLCFIDPQQSVKVQAGLQPFWPKGNSPNL